jgi:hypothetical protein
MQSLFVYIALLGFLSINFFWTEASNSFSLHICLLFFSFLPCKYLFRHINRFCLFYYFHILHKFNFFFNFFLFINKFLFVFISNNISLIPNYLVLGLKLTLIYWYIWNCQLTQECITDRCFLRNCSKLLHLNNRFSLKLLQLFWQHFSFLLFSFDNHSLFKSISAFNLYHIQFTSPIVCSILFESMVQNVLRNFWLITCL